MRFQTNFVSGSIPYFLRMINIKEGEQSGSKIRIIFLRPTALATGPSMMVRQQTRGSRVWIEVSCDQSH